MNPIAEEPGLIAVPVHISGIPDLGAFQFTLQYDPSKLVLTDVTEWLQGIGDVTVGLPEPGKITFAWAADTKGITCLDDLLCRLLFKVVSTENSEISWINDPTPAEFSDFDGNLFQPLAVNRAVGNLTGVGVLNGSSWSVNPNPVNDLATLSFVLPAATDVEIGIYDHTGKQCAVIMSGNMPAGNHHATWNGTGGNGERLSPGIYYCRFTAAGQTSVKKLVILP
jgi:hypothetical protein